MRVKFDRITNMQSELNLTIIGENIYPKCKHLLVFVCLVKIVERLKQQTTKNVYIYIFDCVVVLRLRVCVYVCVRVCSLYGFSSSFPITCYQLCALGMQTGVRFEPPIITYTKTFYVSQYVEHVFYNVIYNKCMCLWVCVCVCEIHTHTHTQRDMCYLFFFWLTVHNIFAEGRKTQIKHQASIEIHRRWIRVSFKFNQKRITEFILSTLCVTACKQRRCVDGYGLSLWNHIHSTSVCIHKKKTNSLSRL